MGVAGDGLYRQLEVITMATFIALMVGVGAIVGVFAAIFVIVAAGWFFQTSH